MGIDRIDTLNQKRFKKLQEVEIYLNTLNSLSHNRKFHFNIEHIKLELRGLMAKFQRDTINISILSEVSSGKSTFLNALVFGEPILESTIGETTAKIFNIRYDKQFSINGDKKKSLMELKEQIHQENQQNLEEINNKKNVHKIQSIITLPNQNLQKGIELYDTPGFATLNEAYMLPLLRETISKSDATILLLDISQGIKKSEHHFIKYMLKRIKHNKRFIVLNKYDTLMSEDNLILKSKEEIEQEIKNLIENIESKLQLLQEEPHQKIETFHLSAKKALIAKMQHDNGKLKESRFDLFEESFWTRIIGAKDEIFEDNVNTFFSLKEEINKGLAKEKELLKKQRNALKIKLRSSLESEDKVKLIEQKLSKLNALNTPLLQKKAQERLILLEDRLIMDTQNMLQENLASELSNIPLANKILFWKLKESYRQSILSVIEEARTFLIKHINFFIVAVTKEQKEKDTLIKEINRDLNTLFLLERYEKKVDLEATINRVISRIEGYVEWNFMTFIGLLSYNLFSQKEKKPTPSFIELTSEISTIKRELNTLISNSKAEIDEYIIFVEKRLHEIKESLKNRDTLEHDIMELGSFIEEIEALDR